MEKARWSLAVVTAAGLIAGPGFAEQRAPGCTVLRGQAGDLDDIADLLEDLGRTSEGEEPVLREILRTERGYEYTVVVSEPGPAPAASPQKELPIFAARPLTDVLERLLAPPFT